MIGKRIRRARKGAGLSMRALAERAGLSCYAIKKYEDDSTTPSCDVLVELARALKVRTSYFFREDIGPVVLEDIKYRKRSSLPEKLLDAITFEVVEQLERRLELESFVPHTPIRTFSTVSGLPGHISAMDEIEDLALRVRQEWNLGLGSIPRLASTLEANGLRVFIIRAGSQSKFDGLAARAKGIPIAVIGLQWPGDRQRFTLAHELGRFMLDGRLSGGLDEELACNRFAGAFLFPRTAVFERLGDHRNIIEVKELDLLKQEFGLSMSGILYRARDLGVISRSVYSNMHEDFRSRGWLQHEPGRSYPREQAYIQEQLAFHAMSEEYISTSKAANLMGISSSEFAEILAMEKIHCPSPEPLGSNREFC